MIVGSNGGSGVYTCELVDCDNLFHAVVSRSTLHVIFWLDTVAAHEHLRRSIWVESLAKNLDRGMVKRMRRVFSANADDGEAQLPKAAGSGHD